MPQYSTAKCKLEPSLRLGQEIPLYPWTKLATDIFHFEGASYLLIVDYTSLLPSSAQAYINDRATHCKPIQTDMFRIWMA